VLSLNTAYNKQMTTCLADTFSNNHESFFTARCYAKRGIYCCKMSVRLSICLSVTRRYIVETAEHITKLFFTSGRHTSFVFTPKVAAIFQWGPPNGGVEWVWRHENNRDFRPITRFISEMI